MAGSSFGTLFRISTWGESHGKALGVVVDGCPAGLEISEEYIQSFLNRRKPGQNAYSTQRSESDSVQILSGVFEGKTTGTPISMVVFNEDQKSKDYGNLATSYRPGHADYGFDAKYGFRDYRGGGRSSGRETIGRVAAGAIATKILNSMGITLLAYTKSIGNNEINYDNFDKNEIYNNPLYMPDAHCAKKSAEFLKAVMADKDSTGSSVECIIKGVPAGIGEPVFNKLDAVLSQAIMSIGAVKVVDGNVVKQTNHSGGTLGGISDGSDIIINASFKPTPSIFKQQQTINNAMENIDIEIKGRHDPIIGPRAVVVVESMCALTILDMLMINATSKLDNLIKLYK